MSETSEFGGQDGPAGVDPRNPTSSLTASEKLMLFYRTGTERANAELDPAFWRGDDQAKYDKLNASLKK